VSFLNRSVTSSAYSQSQLLSALDISRRPQCRYLQEGAGLGESAR